MTAREKLRNLMSELLAMTEKYGRVTTDKGVLQWDREGAPIIGEPIFRVYDDGTDQCAEDGEYTTEEGAIFKVAKGRLIELQPTTNNLNDYGKDK